MGAWTTSGTVGRRCALQPLQGAVVLPPSDPLSRFWCERWGCRCAVYLGSALTSSWRRSKKVGPGAQCRVKFHTGLAGQPADKQQAAVGAEGQGGFLHWVPGGTCGAAVQNRGAWQLCFKGCFVGVEPGQMSVTS